MRLVILVALVILLVGCAKEAVPGKPVPEVSLPPPPAVEPVAQETQPVQEIQAPAEQPSPELEGLLNKVKKVKSYQFTYSPPPDNKARERYWVKGSKMKMKKLYTPNIVDPEQYYDTVYFDLEKKMATAYCQERRPCQKTRMNNVALDFGSVMIRLPHEWLTEIAIGSVDAGGKLFDRNTKKVMYDGKTQWLDADYALPVRILVDGSRYDFEDMAVNSVTDADMTP
ncbi:hypothetical protein HY639_03515 [Candidatus Woesearchaeota archaeon]|nr:hypothetical protein [Candidatus Woesearchaeota archaeon]